MRELDVSKSTRCHHCTPSVEITLRSKIVEVH